MDTRSGELWDMKQVKEAFDPVAFTDEYERERNRRLRDAIENDRLVEVSGEVAQKVRLGERELNRRERRRRARRS
jgi:hypothetical protein